MGSETADSPLQPQGSYNSSSHTDSNFCSRPPNQMSPFLSATASVSWSLPHPSKPLSWYLAPPTASGPRPEPPTIRLSLPTPTLSAPGSARALAHNRTHFCNAGLSLRLPHFLLAIRVPRAQSLECRPSWGPSTTCTASLCTRRGAPCPSRPLSPSRCLAPRNQQVRDSSDLENDFKVISSRQPSLANTPQLQPPAGTDTGPEVTFGVVTCSGAIS